MRWCKQIRNNELRAMKFLQLLHDFISSKESGMVFYISYINLWFKKWINMKEIMTVFVSLQPK